MEAATTTRRFAQHGERVAPLVFALALALGGCGSTRAPEWPARPFHRADAELTGDGASSELATELHARLLDHHERDLGDYVVRGGVAVEGTVSTRIGSWPVVGTYGSSDAWAGLDLRLRSDRAHWFTSNWYQDTGHCTATTSIPFPSSGRCPRSALGPRTAFDVEVGNAPDLELLHIEVTPASSACPDWLLAALRESVSSRAGFEDGGGRWSWAASGDVPAARVVSREADTCCWEHADWTARAWVEPQCPGRYGVDLTMGPVIGECAPCAAPPAGCAPG